MMLIKVDVDSSLTTKRTHNKLMRKLYRQAMTRVRFEYWPKHFKSNQETQPGGGYGYERRSSGWQIKKARIKGHQKPLVFSGRMRQSILGGPQITATANGGRIRSRNYFPMTLTRRNEIEAVSQKERRELAERMQRDYVRYADRPEYQRQRKR